MNIKPSKKKNIFNSKKVGDPYIKLKILNDENDYIIKKTSYKNKNLNPEFNEILKF